MCWPIGPGGLQGRARACPACTMAGKADVKQAMEDLRSKIETLSDQIVEVRQLVPAAPEAWGQLRRTKAEAGAFLKLAC